MVDRDTPIPPSWQIANALREQITAGALGPGTRIPSIVSLASSYQVAPDTARKAIRMLKAEGLAETVPGYGTFVAKNGLDRP
jgi:DNA-binding GntR family transcriptional regulator